LTKSNDDLLQQMRDDFQYCVDYWKDIRDEGREDMRFVSGDAWPKKEKDAREKDGRPCLELDELNQYTNQLINDVRRSKRAIKVVPKGNGANDKTARLRQGLIRQIEYQSKAQTAYVAGFENAIQRSFGCWRVSKHWVPGKWEQELRITRIPNPESVYFDPDAKEVDCSDGRLAFVGERMRRTTFKRRWRNAKCVDFSADLADISPLWGGEDWVHVAEYWRAEEESRPLLLLDLGPAGRQSVYAEEVPGGKVMGREFRMPDGQMVPVVDSRNDTRLKIWQRLTNGFEWLEETEWDGKYIPLVPCFGKELYVDDGAGNSKRVLLSLVRLARDPVMLYNYYRTCQAEIVGMCPKTPWVGYSGQFVREGWEDAHRKPIPFLEAEATTELTPSGVVLPLPQRQIFQPPIQELEIGAEAARRAIQASMGMFNASVGRRDSASQSGVAINALDEQSDQGNFHFVDNFDAAVEHTGRILEDLLDKTYDTEREEGIRKPDDEYQMVRLNAGPYEDPQTKETVEYRMGEGDHEVTISTGASFQSEREEAGKFAESLLTTPLFPRVADLVVRLRNLGPIGDEIAKRLTPPEFQQPEDGQQMSPQAAQALAQLQQQLQAAVQAGQQMSAELDKAKSGEALKRMEIESRERIALMQAQVQLITTDAKLTTQEGLALLNAKIQELGTQLAALSAPVEPQLVDPAQQPIA
jgi:hypothetical protein